MNFLYLLGVTTNWCDNLIANSALYQSCLSSLDGYFYESEKFLYGLLGFAVFQFLPYFAQITMLSKIENEISFNLRKNLYEKLLHLEVKFYERPENESGGAASRFGHDSRACCELLTTYVPIVLSNFCTVVAAVVICFSFSWKFGVLSMMVTPLIALSYYIAMLFIGGYEDSSLELMHEADQIANELIVSIKTALALNYQDRLLEKYKRFIDEPLLDILKVGAKIGVLYGCASLILEVVVGLALYLVVVIYVDDPSIEPLTIIIFMIVSILSGFITGNNFFFIAHISAGKEAGARIMKLVHSKTEKEKQNPSTPTEAKDKWEIEGHIEFKNVNFRYKDDDEKLVLNNVSFVIEPGMKVGFVGPSGCGKSTILQLLLRFYEFEGEILLDGKNIFEYSLEEYRAYFGMLNQEPSLFAGSIEENIRYNMLVRYS
jgi:ATP-binding cassette subfamily B (MDR/TAP) protein 1